MSQQSPEPDRPSVLVFGAGGHAGVVIDAIERQARFTIAGIIDLDTQPGTYRHGYPILANQDTCFAVVHRVRRGIVAVGDNAVRARIVEHIAGLLPSFEFVTVIHPFTSVAQSVRLGAGVVVLAGAIINSGTRIGAHCIINTRSSVDHDCVLREFVSIAPGATLGGHVCLGAYTAIGLGASLIHEIAVGEHSVIGAGSTVVSTLGSRIVAFGSPAKIVRPREPGDAYL